MNAADLDRIARAHSIRLQLPAFKRYQDRREYFEMERTLAR